MVSECVQNDFKEMVINQCTLKKPGIYFGLRIMCANFKGPCCQLIQFEFDRRRQKVSRSMFFICRLK